jgi:trimethylamine---corrinoid protein Co-methyltransferase
MPLVAQAEHVGLAGHICKRPHEFLARDEVERIVDGALEVLADTGMIVAHPTALALLREAGCAVDEAAQRVRFPRDVVQWAIDQCPATFQQQARNPDLTLNWGGETIYFGAFPGFTSLDLASRERRVSSVEDLARLTRLCDAMPEVHTICQPTPHLRDKPVEVEMEWVLATTFRNTEKTTMGASFAGCSRWVVEMCRALGQQVHGSICMASPLTIPVDQAQGVLDYAGAGHPLHLLSGPMRGASGPATMAGTLVLQTAEILGGLVLGQAVRPGLGAIYVGYATPMDMRLGTMASGSIDVGIMGAASGQIARYLGMPSAVFFPMTDAKLPDAQASYERHLQALLCAQAGVNHIMALGGLDNEGAFSPEQMVIDNEVCGMITKVLDGIRVDDVRLAIDVIKEVGPIPGNYLGKEHTRRHWKEDYFLPKVSVRETYDAWVAAGSKGALERAAEIAARVMATHQVKPLPPEVDRELDRILAAAEAEKLGTTVR